MAASFQLREPKLRGFARDLFEFEQQQKWIDYCEGNGVSYSGPNGQSIRKADSDKLQNLEIRVREHLGMQH